MPRRRPEPPFPNSPGAWLAAFRRRLRLDDGLPPTPEQLGAMLAISGATVRRWEANTAIPRPATLARFAEVCGLSAFHSFFVQRACTRIRPPRPPDAAYFQDCVAQCLPLDRPAVIVDSMLYVRAWNSYVDALWPGTAALFRAMIHPVRLFMDADAWFGPPRDGATDFAQLAVRLFWIVTAPMSYLPEHARLVGRLCRSERFKAYWLELINADVSGVVSPLGFSLLDSEGCSYRFQQTQIFIPDTFSLYEMRPHGPAGRQRVEDLRSRAPATVAFARRLHWSDAR